MRTIFLLLLCCCCRWSYAADHEALCRQLSEKFYGGKSSDLSKYIDPKSDCTTLCNLLSAIAQRQRSKSLQENLRLKEVMRIEGSKLLQQLKNSPDAVNTFVLAELLDFPPAAMYDPQLAAVLYKYSAERDFPPAMLRLAAMLESGAVLKRNRKLSAGLMAGSKLDLPPDGANAVRDIFKRQDISSLQKISQLTALALEKRCSAPLALALIYWEKPLPEPIMAVNSALLAMKFPELRDKALPLLQEFDRNGHWVFIQLAALQGELNWGNDLECLQLDSDSVRLNLLQRNYDAVQQELLKLLETAPRAVYGSGLLLELATRDYPAEKMEKLLRVAPTDSLGGLINHAVIAAVYNRKDQQLKAGARVLEFIKKAPLPEKFNWRRELAAVIPGAVGDPPDNRLHQWQFAWNIAILLQIDALLSKNAVAEAEKLLKTYPLQQLAEPYAGFQRNFVRRFAVGLTR